MPFIWTWFLSGVRTAKGFIEGLCGRDSITGEKLNGFERSMCFVGTVPFVGDVAKGFVKSAKVTKAISRTTKVAKWTDRAYTAKSGIDLLKKNDD